MTLLLIQLVTMVLYTVEPDINTGPVAIAYQYLLPVNEMFNVITRSVYFYFFCFTENCTCLGNHTNNNFGTGVNEIVLR